MKLQKLSQFLLWKKPQKLKNTPKWGEPSSPLIQKSQFLLEKTRKILKKKQEEEYSRIEELAKSIEIPLENQDVENILLSDVKETPFRKFSAIFKSYQFPQVQQENQQTQENEKILSSRRPNHSNLKFVKSVSPNTATNIIEEKRENSKSRSLKRKIVLRVAWNSTTILTSSKPRNSLKEKEEKLLITLQTSRKSKISLL